MSKQQFPFELEYERREDGQERIILHRVDVAHPVLRDYPATMSVEEALTLAEQIFLLVKLSRMPSKGVVA